LGAAVLGTTTVGATPNLPAGDGSGIGATPATALSPLVAPDDAVVVVVVGGVVVVVDDEDVEVVVVVGAVVVVVGAVVVVALADAVVVVVVVVVDLPENRSAPVVITTAATTTTMIPRRKFLRRFASRCICSSFARRCAFCRCRLEVAMGATLLEDEMCFSALN